MTKWVVGENKGWRGVGLVGKKGKKRQLVQPQDRKVPRSGPPSFGEGGGKKVGG